MKLFHGEWTKRSQAILASLYEAVTTAAEPIADVEFWFRGSDTVAPGPHFGLSRVESDGEEEQMWLLVSDFASFLQRGRRLILNVSAARVSRMEVRARPKTSH